MSHQCEIKEQEAQPALTIRTRAAVQDLPQVMGQSYQAIFEHLQEVGQYPAGPPFAAYYNMDMADLDIELGFPVSGEVAEKDNIKMSQFPGGKFAVCLYTGPYSDIEEAYNALTEWIAAEDVAVTGAAYELYLNDPSETPPEELQTQIMLPLQ